MKDDEYLASLQADREKELKALQEAEAAREEERRREEEARKKLQEEQVMPYSCLLSSSGAHILLSLLFWFYN